MSDYTHSNATITASNKINPIYPVNEKLTEDYIHKLITDDVLSVTAQKGKIPVADPETGMIDSSWLGIDPNASYAVDATTTRKGIIEIATNAEAITGTDTERAVTPAGVKASIDNSFTTSKATTTQAGTVILSNLIDNSQDKAVTPYAVKNYLASSNFARAGYNVTGVTPYASVTNVSGIISESKTKPINTLKNDTRYKEVAVDPYSLYNYISNNDMYLNVNRQSVGGIIFRELVEDDSGTKVTATEKSRLYVNKDTGNTYLKVGSKTLTLLDTAGNTTVPTSVITPAIKNSSGDAPKLGTKQIGSASQPIYIASDGTITKCNTIDNVNNAVNATNATNATTASKLGSSDVGSSTKPIYLAKGVATASNSSIGNANTPVYMNAGTITSTGKSFANYLPLAGGTMTGPIYVNYSSQNTGVQNAMWGNMATNDGWGIRVGATASDSGYLEIATCDNANEPIYVRQYSGGNFGTLKRTAALLDESGNTIFPGNVKATGGFTGNLSGNSTNVTGTVAIAHGGTGATARTAAVKALFNEGVEGNATHLLGITSDWSKCGYVYKDSLKSILGLGNYLPLSGGTMSGEIYRKDTGAAKGTKPSSNRWKLSYMFTDKNNVMYGGIENGYLTDRTNRVNMIVYPGTTTNTNTNAQIGVGFDSNGNWFTYAPTPASGDNSTKIATTEFVKNYALSSTLPVPSTTTTAVGYIFTGYGRYHTLPSGGTWFWWACCFNANSTSIGPKWGISAGGKEIDLEYDNRRAHFFAMRLKT